MTHRKQKRLLVVINAALTCGVVAALAVSLLLPLAGDEDISRPARSAVTANIEPDGDLKPLSEYTAIGKVNLRRSLFDPKPVRKIVKKPAPAKLTVKLAGTVVEPGFTYGLFTAKDGRTQLVSAGQSIEGAEVIAIADGSATIRFDGRVIELKVPAEEGKQ